MLDSFARWMTAAGGIWTLLSGVLNFVFWFHSPEEWVAWAERNPRGAPLVRLSRAWGFDPMKGLIALRDLADRHRAHQHFSSPIVARGPATPLPVVLDGEGTQMHSLPAVYAAPAVPQHTIVDATPPGFEEPSPLTPREGRTSLLDPQTDALVPKPSKE